MGNNIKILIVEDELPAAKRLQKLLKESAFEIEVIHHCESIFSAVTYLQNSVDIDLILMDIRLGDGISFDIFKQVELHTPIIFTTAFDEYMMKAFKVNSIDYLLKPIDPIELNESLEKYTKLHKTENQPDLTSLLSIIQQGNSYKERFLIKSGSQILIVPTQEINYIYSEDGYSFLITTQGKKHIIDQTLDQIQKEVNPKDFFRINRSMIIKTSAIAKVEQYFNSRYVISLEPTFHEQAIVSREKVKEFKEWLEG